MTYVCLSHEKKEEALPPYLTTEVKGEGPKTNWSPKTSAKTKMGPESLSPCIKALLPLLLCEKSAFEDNKSFLSLCLSHFKERPPSVFFTSSSPLLTVALSFSPLPSFVLHQNGFSPFPPTKFSKVFRSLC